MKEEQNSAKQSKIPQGKSSDREGLREQSPPVNQTGSQPPAEGVEEAERASNDHEGEGTGARAGEYS